MPEGHSVVRWARGLAPLVGEPLLVVAPPQRWQALAAELLRNLPCKSEPPLRIDRIQTHGKHLLLHLSRGYTIHCHGLMYGSWQFGKAGMSLRRPEERVRLRLRTAEREAVFYNGPVVEFLPADQLRTHERITALGPDILHPGFDRDEVWGRLQAKQNLQREIGDAILDQTILAGIGNIFKSEGLFLARIHPRRRVHTFSRADIERLWDFTLPLMQAAARSTGPIRTLPLNLRRGKKGRDALNFVYFRNGRPCFLCGTKLLRTVQGDLDRSTYFCPKCQA